MSLQVSTSFCEELIVDLKHVREQHARVRDLKIAAPLVRCLVVSFRYFVLVFDQKPSFEVAGDPWRLTGCYLHTQSASLFVLTLRIL
jgi:hypothetical protein